MNRLAAQALTVASIALICFPALLSAQTEFDGDGSSHLPGGPVAVRFLLVPRYFVQLIENNPRYSGIEALIDDAPGRPLYQVILSEATTGKKVFYSNSADDVNALQQAGSSAYYAAIEFTALEKTVLTPTFRIRFRDHSGEEINWRFIVNRLITEEQTVVVPQSGAAGIGTIFSGLWSAAAPGTAVTIGNETNVAKVSEPTGKPEDTPTWLAFYANRLMVAQIAPGIPLWYVDLGPAQRKIATPQIPGLQLPAL